MASVSILDTLSPAQLAQFYSNLLDTNDPIFVFNCTYATAKRLLIMAGRSGLGVGPTGLDIFGRACLSADIVKTFAKLIKLHPPPRSYRKEIYMTQYAAFASLRHLLAASKGIDRRILVDQMVAHGMYDVLTETLGHPLCIFRCIAVETIAATTHGPNNLWEMPTKMTMSVAAGMLIGLYKVVLEGSDKLKEQLNSRDLAWGRELRLELGMPVPRDPTELTRHLAHYNDCIIVSACEFLHSYQLPTYKNRLEIVKCNPGILDVLFDCAIMPRPTIFPTSLVSIMACHMLHFLFERPLYIVPGVSTPMDSTRKMRDWKLLSQCLTILTSRENWAEKIIETCMKVEEEDYLEIRTMLEQAPPGNYPGMSSVNEAIVQIAEHRGWTRTVILRLISTLTYTAQSCGVTNAEIESFLRIAYTACRRIRPKGECQSGVEHLLHAERTIGDNDFRLVACRGTDPVSFTVGGESVLGPIALTRLLVVLAQRKALDAIQGLKKPPIGLSSCTSLHHVQQITHPVVIQRFLTIALRRMGESTARGRSRLMGGQHHLALVAFTCSAELAAALVAFDTQTEGQYSNYVRGARRELAIALFHISVTALKTKDYLETQNFALSAISAVENIPAVEGVDRNIVVERCRLLIQEAQKLARDNGRE